ncbi:signal peptidase I SipW [Neobacillus sp. NPDC058068]|uniref:signal peptidase I SipW n=1 Tax=Neobacillus sp. NPDC058068 TaxID=3346325 RepID=UPI0036DF5197
MAAKKALKIVSKLISVLLFLLLIFLSYVVISTKISGGETKLLGYELKSILSGSMEPSIHTGSVIAIKPGGDLNRFKKGDVITYRTLENPDVLITHRIREIHVSDSLVQYITKGDANDADDPQPIPASNVIGKYSNITIPYVGYILSYAKSKIGIILLTIVPGVLILLYQLFFLIRRVAKLEKENKLVKERMQL